MRSVYIVLDRTAAVIQSLKRRLAEAEAREKSVRSELTDQQHSLRSLGKGLGLDEALSAVSSAADRTEAIARALDDMKARLHARETALNDVIHAMELPADIEAGQLASAAKDFARRAHALEILHPVLRQQAKSVATFANYLITNAEDDTKLRRYIGLPTDKKAG